MSRVRVSYARPVTNGSRLAYGFAVVVAPRLFRMATCTQNMSSDSGKGVEFRPETPVVNETTNDPVVSLSGGRRKHPVICYLFIDVCYDRNTGS